jgi:formylglycine-generating enzyme required for sulfatase activity
MHGNIWQWIENCYHENCKAAPQDGSAWVDDPDCSRRIVRGGSWSSRTRDLRAALRVWYTSVVRYPFLGFRVGRTLSTGADAITVAPGGR